MSPKKISHPPDGQAHGICTALCGKLSGISHFFFVKSLQEAVNDEIKKVKILYH